MAGTLPTSTSIQFNNFDSIPLLIDSVEFQTEVIFLGQLKHAHLVKLIGYCCEDEHRMLVYEYMPRGSLENQLFKSMEYNPLYLLSSLFLLRS